MPIFRGTTLYKATTSERTSRAVAAVLRLGLEYSTALLRLPAIDLDYTDQINCPKINTCPHKRGPYIGRVHVKKPVEKTSGLNWWLVKINHWLEKK